MAERDDDDKKPSHDPDRAAILERRNRFIALALTGLSTACTGNPPKPQPCLSEPPRQEKADDDGGPPPQPCLSVPIEQPDPQPRPDPQVCLKMAAPPDDGGEAEAGEPAPPEPQPHPCLSKPAPKPCLKQATPQPCLKVVEPS